MKQVQVNTVVTLVYTLKEHSEKGPTMEIMDYKWPLIFLVGHGKMLPAFEEHLTGLAENESFQFTLQPEEAYGNRKGDQIVTFEKDMFLSENEYHEESLKMGVGIALKQNDRQNKVGMVTHVDSKEVTVDFNHAMAGKTLYFEGRIMRIRKANDDEIVRGHHSMSDGVHF